MLKTANKNDYKRIIKTINCAFKTSFGLILPKLYKNHPEVAAFHRYAEDEKGKMIATTLTYPAHMHVDDSVLKCWGVGSVATLKRARGKGLMHEMMLDAVKIGIDNDADIMMLGGKRHRYERYGFVPCGAYAEFRVHGTDVKYRNIDGFNFVNLDKNSNYLDNIIASHNALEMRAEREKGMFFETLCSYLCKTYVVLKNGEYCGYIVKQWKTIVEIVLNGAEVDNAVAAFIKAKKLRGINVIISPEKGEDLKKMFAFADDFKFKKGTHINVLNHKNVIEILLNFKAKTEPLTDGEFNLKIDETTYKIAVNANVATVEQTDEAPNASFTKSEASILMFFPHSVYAQKYPLLRNWFPLPLHISTPDTF
jgi:predicted N-acetyltransferase YhbS